MKVGKGYLREFYIKTDGTLQLRINVWKPPKELLEALQKAFDTPEFEVNLIPELNGLERDAWLNSEYALDNMPKCQSCGSLIYLMETDKGIFCEKCLDEQARAKLGIVVDEVNGGKKK